MSWKGIFDVWPGYTEPALKNSGPYTAEEKPGLDKQTTDQNFEGTRLWIAYFASAGEKTERWVRIGNFERKQYADYLNGFCELRNDWRSFRLDRIAEVATADDGEIHDPREFFKRFLPEDVKGRSSGPSRHSAFGRALRLVEELGDMVRILAFVAEYDGSHGRKEAAVISGYVAHEAQALGIDVTKRDMDDFRLWTKLLRPDAAALEAATRRISSKGQYTADDIWDLACLVIEADGKIKPEEREAMELLRKAIHSCFT